jgi:outer membrane protein assembly factor BamE
MFCRLLIIIAALSLSACSSWVFRYDIAQGNYLDQKSINKLQVGMTKEQVKFILGSPVVIDAFSNDTWNYVYTLKSGRDAKYNQKKHFILEFSKNLLISASGDYKLSEDFNTPFNKTTKTKESDIKD